MRYFINFDKTINQLVPYFFGGRKLILYLQALMSPLRRVNDDFVDWAKETKIEASMTSEVFKFEWYLNRKFSKYFADTGRITIRNSEPHGAPIYHQLANVENNRFIVSKKDNDSVSETAILYRSDEPTNDSSVSFIVYTPKIDADLISESKYMAMLKFVIDKYRLANKTYEIKYK